MNINEANRKNIEKMTTEFDNMVSKGTLNISNIENLLIDNIEDYKNNINNYMEELISSHINEKELISKKTRMERKRIRIKKHWKKEIGTCFDQ